MLMRMIATSRVDGGYTVRTGHTYINRTIERVLRGAKKKVESMRNGESHRRILLLFLFVHTKKGVNVAKNVVEWDGDVEQEEDDDEDCMVHDKGNGEKKVPKI